LRKVTPLFILGLILVLALSLPLWSNTSLSVFAAYNTFQNAVTLGLLALAVGVTIIVGEFDLSSIAVFTLGGLLAVHFGEANPLLGVLIAMTTGGLIGAAQGGLMAATGISSVPLTLGVFIALSGLNHIVAEEGILSYGNFDVGLWLDLPIAHFFSMRILLVLAVFIAVAVVMSHTRLGTEVRATGADRRATRASGVPTVRMVTGVLIFAGACSALGGALFF
jgi:ribose transport system permease protein